MDVLAEAGNTVGIVRGGMGSITRAMRASAEAHGAVVRTSAEVARVVVEDGRAVGVQLTDGSVVRASAVVSNADPKRTFLGLVDAGRPAGRLPGLRRAPLDPRLVPEVPRRDEGAAGLLALPRPRLRSARHCARLDQPVDGVLRAGVARRGGRRAVTRAGDVDPDPVDVRRLDRAARPARPLDLRDVRTGQPEPRLVGRTARGDRRTADRRRHRVRARTSGRRSSTGSCSRRSTWSAASASRPATSTTWTWSRRSCSGRGRCRATRTTARPSRACGSAAPAPIRAARCRACRATTQRTRCSRRGRRSDRWPGCSHPVTAGLNVTTARRFPQVSGSGSHPVTG